MKKTISINLGGFLFHIDEDAFQQLSNYINTIKKSVDPEGKDEIIADIESRIAELFLEKIKDNKQVINTYDVDAVIKIMGQPEDYILDDVTENESSNSKNHTSKKLFRDKKSGSLGGVCAGLAHYFGIDPVWLKIIFLILIPVTGGTFIPIYILLWIVIPKATTTSERLQMQGKPINVSNIEQKVKEGISSISDNINNLETGKAFRKSKSALDEFLENLGGFLKLMFNLVTKAFGAFLLIISTLLFVAITTASITMIFYSNFPNSLTSVNVHPFISSVPVWVQGLIIFFTFAIPALTSALLGFKILVPNAKRPSKYVNFTLFAIWLISTVCFILLLVQHFSNYKNQNTVKQNIPLNLVANDTLQLKMNMKDIYGYDEGNRNSTNININGIKRVFSDNVSLKVHATTNKEAYMILEKRDWGASKQQAYKNAEKIEYNFTYNKNILIFDEVFKTNKVDLFDVQKVTIHLYLPEGLHLQTSKGIEEIDNSNNSFFDLQYDYPDAVYEVGTNKIACKSCPNTVIEWTENNNETNNDVILKINGDTIISKSEDNSSEPKNMSIKIGDKEIFKLDVKENSIKIETND